MEEENKKEILTRAIIKKELREVYLYNGLVHLFEMLGSILGFVIVYLCGQASFKGQIANFTQMAVTLISITTILFALVIFILWHISLYGVCKFFGLMILVSNDKFDIVVDKLVDSKKLVSTGDQVMIEEVSDHKIRPKIYLYKHIVPRPKQYFYKLFFEKCKEYDIPEGKLYNWSKTNSMNDWQIFRSAEINDDFYLITRKNKVLYVYNTKHFELKN